MMTPAQSIVGQSSRLHRKSKRNALTPLKHRFKKNSRGLKMDEPLVNNDDLYAPSATISQIGGALGAY